MSNNNQEESFMLWTIIILVVACSVLGLFFKENRNTKNVLNVIGWVVLLVVIGLAMLFSKMVGLS